MAAQGKHYRRVFSLGARDYFFRGRCGSWLSTHLLNMIPIDRSRPDFRTINRCAEVVKRSGIILMFPEGTRSLTGEIQPFRLGLGLVAQRLDVPIVPVLVRGTHQALPKGTRFPRRGAIDVVFGEPIRVRNDAAGRLSYAEIARRTSSAVADLQRALLDSRDGKRDTEWNTPITRSL
jgi:1-acyl-sn-glycerol-3-phosphate acyltransferase